MYLQNRNKFKDIENKFMVTNGKVRWRGINQEYGINRYKLQYIKQISKEDLLYNTGKYIQYFAITYNGKQSEIYIYREILYIYIYIYD